MDNRERMIQEQLLDRDIYDESILEAMLAVDREIFLPDELRDMAYDDSQLRTEIDQTISQPYIVAYMAQAMDLQPEDKVLEVGSGCGYNAAVLYRLVLNVYSLEIIGWLAELAKENLAEAGIPNVSVRFGDGQRGWPDGDQ